MSASASRNKVMPFDDTPSDRLEATGVHLASLQAEGGEEGDDAGDENVASDEQPSQLPLKGVDAGEGVVPESASAAPTEAPVNPLAGYQPDEVEQFLCQIPPDWDKAAAHGRANLVVFGTELKPDEKDTYCICCHLPHPEDENFKSLACANSELGEMGPGYPLYLELIKKVSWLMLFLTIFYAVPSGYLIFKSQTEILWSLQPDDSPIALFSFGAYIFNS